MTTPHDRWRAIAAADLLWHGFDDEFVVFNLQTGNTHALHPVNAALLHILQDAHRSLDIASLELQLQQLQQSAGDGYAPVDSAVIHQSLADLSKWGLTTLESA